MAETAAIYFPYNMPPVTGSWSRETINDDDVEKGFTGIEQRMARYPDPGYEYFRMTTQEAQQGVTTSAPGLGGSSGDPVTDFMFLLTYARGRVNTFYFFPFDSEYFLNVALGTYPGSGTFTIPYRLRDQNVLTGGFNVLKVGGVTQTFGIDYAINSNGTTIFNSATIISFAGGVGAGAVTGSFYGSKRLICRFDQNRSPRQLFAGGNQENATGQPRLQWAVAIEEVR